MFKITKNPKTPNMLWDPINKRVFCKFDKSGVIETNDPALAEILRNRGHKVEGESDFPVIPPDDEVEVPEGIPEGDIPVAQFQEAIAEAFEQEPEPSPEETTPETAPTPITATTRRSRNRK